MSKKKKEITVVYLGRTWEFGEKGFSHCYLPLETVEEFIEWAHEPKNKAHLDEQYRDYAKELFHKKGKLRFDYALGVAQSSRKKPRWDASDIVGGIYTMQVSEDDKYSNTKWTGETVGLYDEDQKSDWLHPRMDPLQISLDLRDRQALHENKLYRKRKSMKRSKEDEVLAALLPLRNALAQNPSQRNKWKLKILNYLDGAN
jgi:hypothetical protein